MYVPADELRNTLSLTSFEVNKIFLPRRNEREPFTSNMAGDSTSFVMHVVPLFGQRATYWVCLTACVNCYVQKVCLFLQKSITGNYNEEPVRSVNNDIHHIIPFGLACLR